MKKIKVQYFALLREERGVSSEIVQTQAQSLDEFYQELKEQHNFRLNTDVLRASLNCEFVPWDSQITDGDEVVFIPPVAGG